MSENTSIDEKINVDKVMIPLVMYKCPHCSKSYVAERWVSDGMFCPNCKQKNSMLIPDIDEPLSKAVYMNAVKENLPDEEIDIHEEEQNNQS